MLSFLWCYIVDYGCPDLVLSYCVSFAYTYYLNKICMGLFLNFLDSLCCPEGKLKVVFTVDWWQRGVVKLRGEEGVDQGTEGHPVTPAGGEVLDFNVLQSWEKRALFGDDVAWAILWLTSQNPGWSKENSWESGKEMRDRWNTTCKSHSQPTEAS